MDIIQIKQKLKAIVFFYQIKPEQITAVYKSNFAYMDNYIW